MTVTLAFLERLDLGHVIDPGAAGFRESLLDLTDGLGADIAVECSATAHLPVRP
jgi:hypothetical protein